MPQPWEPQLQRWLTAGLLDEATVARIREWEARQPGAQKLRWPILLALTFGGLLLAFGMLSFIAANWDEMSPAARMATVLGVIGGLHVAGACLQQRWPALALTLHALGTVGVGAGIALIGQTFHLQSHWSNAVLLWAAAAMAGWLLRLGWPQLLLTALLVPAFVVSEAERLHIGYYGAQFTRAAAVFVFLTAFAYLAFRAYRPVTTEGVVLGWIGLIALPFAALAVMLSQYTSSASGNELGVGLYLLITIGAVALPLGLIAFTVRPALLWGAGFGAWALLAEIVVRSEEFFMEPWCALGSVLLAYWGVQVAFRPAINLGIALFALSVLAFYFDHVWGLMSTSLALLAGGLLFVGLAAVLERVRRRLVTSAEAA